MPPSLIIFVTTRMYSNAPVGSLQSYTLDTHTHTSHISIYIYIYAYVCIYIHIYTHTHIYIYMYHLAREHLNSSFAFIEVP